jgi:hypothetical protein
VHMSIAFPPMRPSLIGRRVGIRIVTFEACSGFTRVTARTRARPRRSFDPRRLGAACGSRHPRPESLNRPRATLSRGSNPAGYPTKLLASYRTNRQLSGWMESSSTDGSSLRGARPKGDIVQYTRPRNRRPFSESPIRSDIGATATADAANEAGPRGRKRNSLIEGDFDLGRLWPERTSPRSTLPPPTGNPHCRPFRSSDAKPVNVAFAEA